jgi:hypothetical protein
VAHVYCEIEHPKLRNLEKAEFVIFGYSLIYTLGWRFSRHPGRVITQCALLSAIGVITGLSRPYTCACSLGTCERNWKQMKEIPVTF